MLRKRSHRLLLLYCGSTSMQPLRFFQTQRHSVVDVFRRTLSALAVVALLLGPQKYLGINRSADAADSELRFIDSLE